MKTMLKAFVVGHRGSGSGVRSPGGQENTIASFAHAHKNGADAIETDLAMTRDGEIVLFHDEKLAGRRISEWSLSELRTGHPHVPTLREALDQIPGMFILELKHYSDVKTIIEQCFAEFVAPDPSRFRFISFQLEALRLVKNKDEKIFCNFIATCTDERFDPFVKLHHIDACRSHGIDEISGHHVTFRKDKIDRALASGLSVGLGPIDRKWALRRCLSLGVPNIYTNRPDAVRRWLSEP